MRLMEKAALAQAPPAYPGSAWLYTFNGSGSGSQWQTTLSCTLDTALRVKAYMAEYVPHFETYQQPQASIYKGEKVSDDRFTRTLSQILAFPGQAGYPQVAIVLISPPGYRAVLETDMAAYRQVAESCTTGTLIEITVAWDQW